MAKVIVLAATVAVLQLARALTEPNCPVIQGIPCVNFADTFAPGDTVEEILANLHNQFCGCTHILGSIQIDMFGHAGYTNLTEDSFNFLYHVEKIAGVLRFQNIPTVDRIILPNLRIIRGDILIETAEGRGLALVLLNTRIGAFVLPKLTEVKQGDVRFQNTTSSMCNYKTINWNDIIDNGQLKELWACNTSRYEDLLNCSACSSGYCWSTEPLNCQTLTKTPCSSCGLDRCYQTDGGTFQCCNPLCAAGCVGPKASQCHACRNFVNNGTCVTQCPPAMIYDPELLRVVANPNARVTAGDFCLPQCPTVLFEYNGTCLHRCPENYFSRDGQCISCDGACPRECDGLDSFEIVNDMTLERFNNCNIIVNGGLFFGSTGNLDLSRLEILSTIIEIRGPLRIQGWPEQTFPYLRNLRRVGHPNGTTLNLFCNDGRRYDYSLAVAQNLQLWQLDLSSLETISGGGLFFFNNPQLCYVGNFSTYLDNPTSQHQCVVSPFRKDPQTCINEGFICHEQCDSMSNCWGPSDTQCEGCRNFRYLGRCMQNCSVVSPLSNSSGLYQNPDSSVCEPCDAQCVEGCSDGTGPEHCNECRNYYVEEMLGGGPLMRVCVEACPLGTYLNTSSRQCVPCHSACQNGTGCAGPLPYVNRTHGCLECDRVQLDGEGRQVTCLSSGCLPGTYSSVSTTAIGDLRLGSDVCVPCHPLCELCTSPGTQWPTDCLLCRYATRISEGCVESCNTTSEFYVAANRSCVPCVDSCLGCTGPASTDCLQCVPGFAQDFSDDRSSFTCRDGCSLGDYISEEGVCEDCHPLCEQCVGPGPSNCTSCRDSRFQAPVETEGSGGGPQLLECFPCTSSQQLINRTCIDTVAPTEETPTASEETPTASEETPSVSEETPTASEETPTASEETPTASEETPTASERTPTEGTPTASEGTPTASEGTPTASEETPTASEETPTASEGTPTASEGTPTASEETPTASEETPTASEGTPTASEGTPTASEGTPAAVLCNETLGIPPPDMCFSAVTRVIQRTGETEVSSENAQETINNLTMAVELAGEEDQTAMNIAVITEVIVNTSAIVTQTGGNTAISLQQQVNITMNVMRIIDRISTWPNSVTNTPSSRIIRALEMMVALIIQENVDGFVIEGDNVALLVERVDREDLELNGRTFGASGSDDGLVMVLTENSPATETQDASISLPSSLFTELELNATRVGMGFTFYETGAMFPLPEGSPSGLIVGSPVIGALVAGQSFSDLQDPVVILLPFTSQNLSPQCASWNFTAAGGRGNWTTDGCKLARINGSVAVCHCSHLTNFGVLVDICARTGGCATLSPIIQQALSGISIAGASLSLFGLAVTVITILALKKLRERDVSKFHIQLCTALFCLLLVFVSGIQQTSVYGGCVTVSVLIHYFTLVTWMWMGTEAMIMFQKVILVFFRITTKFIVAVSLICWLVPIVPVVIPLAIDRDFMVTFSPASTINSTVGIAGVGSTPEMEAIRYCFIGDTGVFFGAFLGPIFAILLFNTIIFIIVMSVLTKQIRKKYATTNHANRKIIFRLMVSIMGVMSLFGLTWVFGALTVREASTAFQFLFAIFNSLQGFFIFVFFCVFGMEGQMFWVKVLCCKRKMPGIALHTNAQLLKSTVPRKTLGSDGSGTARPGRAASNDYAEFPMSGTSPQPSENETPLYIPTVKANPKGRATSNDYAELPSSSTSPQSSVFSENETLLHVPTTVKANPKGRATSNDYAELPSSSTSPQSSVFSENEILLHVPTVKANPNALI